MIDKYTSIPLELFRKYQIFNNVVYKNAIDKTTICRNNRLPVLVCRNNNEKNNIVGKATGSWKYMVKND